MEITAFKDTDFKELKSFAEPIWEKTYHGVIPEAQIAFLVEKYFSLAGIDKYRSLGYKYAWIGSEGTKAGFAAWVDKGDCIYLDKLYLLSAFQGRHLAREVFSYLIKEYKKPLELNVNRNNLRAVQAYLKAGFEIKEQKDYLLEDGMINSDYIMVKKSL